MRCVTKRTSRAAVAIVTIAVLLGACSGGSDGDGGTAEPDGTVVEEPGASNPDGVIKVGYHLAQVAGGGMKLDPGTIQSGVDDPLLYMIFGRILRPTVEGNLEPDLAESTSVAEDGTSIEVVLRPNLTWSDGTPFTADSVKAGLERTIDSGNQNLTPGFFSLEGVDVTSPTTAVLRVPDGTAASWHDTYLGGWQATIVQPDEDFSIPVGAGPMTVTAHTPGRAMTLAKSDTYWDAESILYGGIELVEADPQQPQSGIAALEAGQINVVQTDITQYSNLSGDLEGMIEADPTSLVNLAICKRDAPLSDARVRVAINKAIDREGISEAIYAGTAVPATELWPEGHRFWDPEIADDLAYDPEGARQLVEESGIGDVAFDMYPLNALAIPEVAQVVQSQLAEVGINASIVPTPNYVTDFLQAQKPGAGVVSRMNPDRGKLDSWSGESLANVCSYDDPVITRIKTDIAKVSDSSDEAVELWHEASARVAEEGLGGLIVFTSKLGAYDSSILSNAVALPRGTAGVIPDPRVTTVNAG
jgi:ABC-type transport system substrate-binding protein